PASPDPERALQVALAGVDSSDIAGAFARARPQHPLYQGLREAMGSLRYVAGEGGWPVLPPGPALKPGDDDPRVLLLRRRLQLSGYLPDDLDDAAMASTHYGAQLAAAALRYQDEQYLDTDSGVGNATRNALNIPVQARIAQLRVNLERARWLLHEIHGDLVVVDIAGFTLHYFDGGPMPVWSSRVQVGQPYRMTPMFKSAIDQITFNPAWVVPPTIYTKDLLPKLRRDRGYLAAHKLHVYSADWKELDPATVDWNRPPAGLRLRQESGSDGALGHIKISFPNPYAVYLHDTPHTAPVTRVQLRLHPPVRTGRAGLAPVQRPRSLEPRRHRRGGGFGRNPHLQAEHPGAGAAGVLDRGPARRHPPRLQTRYLRPRRGAAQGAGPAGEVVRRHSSPRRGWPRRRRGQGVRFCPGSIPSPGQGHGRERLGTKKPRDSRPGAHSLVAAVEPSVAACSQLLRRQPPPKPAAQKALPMGAS